MRDIFTHYFQKLKTKDFGIFFFLSGIFLLPSTLFVAILFLLPAAIAGSFLQKKTFFKDQWNFPFLVFGSLVILSSLSQNFFLVNRYELIWDPKSSIIGMGNWLPFLWLFWAFQPYLDSKSKRRSFALFLTAGTFPVLITGFGQYFFNWHGPFETLNGLIIWYQRPINNPGGLSGLFNNQNYTGTWLNFVWPFCLALLLDKKDDFFKKVAAFGFLFSIGFAGFLTFSRNAWLGLLITFPLVLRKKRFKTILILITIIIFLYLLFSSFSNYLNKEMLNSIQNLSKKIYLEFFDEGYGGINNTRLEIFLSAFHLIINNPIFGIGAASFPAIYQLETNLWKGHSHNLLLELAISYGLPATIIFIFTISIILFLSGRVIFLKNLTNDISLIDRAFWAALFFFLLSQLFDIQYFDGKISIITWILISGLKNIIAENNSKAIVS